MSNLSQFFGRQLKATGTGYKLIPAGPATGTTITRGSTANSYTGASWAQLIASTSAAQYIVGFIVNGYSAPDYQDTYIQIAIGTGAGGSETTISESKIGVGAANKAIINPNFIPFPLEVAASTRIAARIAGDHASGSGNSILLSLIVVDKSDLVPL